MLETNLICQKLVGMMFNKFILSKSQAVGPGRVLGISSDGDDLMEPKVKTQKNPGPQFNPQKIPFRFCGT